MIRKATLDDLNNIHNIECKCFKYDIITLDEFSSLIESQKNLFLTYQIGSKIAGYGIIKPLNQFQMHVYALAILPSFHGKGIAKALMKALERHAIAKGYKQLYLEVKNDNKAAIALYESLDFVIFEVKERFYDDLSTAIVYIKSIKEP